MAVTVSRCKTVLPASLSRVWNVVTDVKRYPEWRSDVERVEVPNDREFWEYTRDGYVTKFTISREETERCWEFSMDNDHMTGRWVGIFRQRGKATIADFTEYVTAKKFWMRPFVKSYLKRQQAQFAADLRAALERLRLGQ